MAKATRDFKLHLELTEDEANDLYIHLNPKYIPNKADAIKRAIVEALGYTPREAPDL